MKQEHLDGIIVSMTPAANVAALCEYAHILGNPKRMQTDSVVNLALACISAQELETLLVSTPAPPPILDFVVKPQKRIDHTNTTSSAVMPGHVVTPTSRGTGAVIAGDAGRFSKHLFDRSGPIRL